MYFDNTSQATVGGMYDFYMSPTSTPQENCAQRKESTASKLNDILLPPKDQELRNVRHHVLCQDLNGVIVYYPPVCQDANTKSQG